MRPASRARRPRPRAGRAAGRCSPPRRPAPRRRAPGPARSPPWSPARRRRRGPRPSPGWRTPRSSGGRRPRPPVPRRRARSSSPWAASRPRACGTTGRRPTDRSYGSSVTGSPVSANPRTAVSASTSWMNAPSAWVIAVKYVSVTASWRSNSRTSTNTVPSDDDGERERRPRRSRCAAVGAASRNAARASGQRSRTPPEDDDGRVVDQVAAVQRPDVVQHPLDEVALRPRPHRPRCAAGRSCRRGRSRRRWSPRGRRRCRAGSATSGASSSRTGAQPPGDRDAERATAPVRRQERRRRAEQQRHGVPGQVEVDRGAVRRRRPASRPW